MPFQQPYCLDNEGPLYVGIFQLLFSGLGLLGKEKNTFATGVYFCVAGS